MDKASRFKAIQPTDPVGGSTKIKTLIRLDDISLDMPYRILLPLARHL
jgi:hypothetical protein